MSSKSIALFQAHLAAQGRAPKAPINILGTTPHAGSCDCGVGDTSRAAHHPDCPKFKARVKKSRAPIAGKVNVQEKK
jgi:hypothetical protein